MRIDNITTTSPDVGLVPSSSFVVGSNLTVENNVITGTTTNPTKATSPFNDHIRYQKLGGKEYQIDMKYSHTSNTGAAAGSGTYLFALPAGLQFSSIWHPGYTGLTNFNDGTHGAANSTIEGSVGWVTNATTFGTTVARVYDSTRFIIGAQTSFGGGLSVNLAIGSGFFPLNSATVFFSMRFSFTAA